MVGQKKYLARTSFVYTEIFKSFCIYIMYLSSHIVEIKNDAKQQGKAIVDDAITVSELVEFV